MSWLFSRALVEEFSAESCSGGEPSALLKSSPTPQAFLPSDRMTDFCRPSRFGMMFAPLTDALGEGLLTWFLGAFRARTFQPPARAPESTGSAPACGGRWRELSVRYDLNSHSWKTHRSLWDEGLPACSLILPKWGSMRDGVLSERTTLALPTSAKDAGLWPTPTASLGTKGGRVTQRKGREGGTLIEAVSQRTYATPTARDWRSGKAGPATMARNSRPLSEQVGGSLNPTWAEWLMGWLLGWTDLGPLATDKCRSAQRMRGEF